MSQENPRYPRLISRPNPLEPTVRIGESIEPIEYTSNTEPVPEAHGVVCRTWKLAGTAPDVDGGDINIIKNGYTKIQQVNDAEFVVDAPESGELLCATLDTEGNTRINHFLGSDNEQIVLTRGMYVSWVAIKPGTITEFEFPPFDDKTFTSLQEDDIDLHDTRLLDFVDTVNRLRTRYRLPKT